MEQYEDRPGADRGREIDRGTADGDGRETTPIQDPDLDERPIAPGLELAGGDRAAQDLRAAAATQRWRDRRPSRRSVALAGARGVLAAIDRGARGPR